MKNVDWYVAGLFIVIALAVFVEHDAYAVLGYFLGGMFYFIDQVIHDETTE